MSCLTTLIHLIKDKMKEFRTYLQKQVDKMSEYNECLYLTRVDKQVLTNTYLTEMNGKVFRDPESNEYKCNHCLHFLNHYGALVSIKEDGSLESIWDVEGYDGEYSNAAKALSEYVKSKPVANKFIMTKDYLKHNTNYESVKNNQSFYKLGIPNNLKRYTKEEVDKFGVVKEGVVYKFEHFSISLPSKFIQNSPIDKSLENHTMLKRLLEFDLGLFETTVELIEQNSLLNGNVHKSLLLSLIDIKLKNYNDNQLWRFTGSDAVCRFRNTLLGKFLIDLESKSLEEACLIYNKLADPVNYKKASAPISQTQINNANKFISENGYEESFNRRLATLSDIQASEILHINNISKKLSIFDSITPNKNTSSKLDVDKIKTISINEFMNEILPTSKSLEAYLLNSYKDNFLSLHTSDSGKNPLKWDNTFAWTYFNNLTGKSSIIKDAVKKRGGIIDGVLNIRLAFPNTRSDYDLHCDSDDDDSINFRTIRRVHKSSGMLDLDAQGVDGELPPEQRVENIIFTDLQKMKGRKYTIYVNNFYRKDDNFGFTIEIENFLTGEIITYEYNKPLKQYDYVSIASFYVDDNNKICIEHDLEPGNSALSSTTLFGLQTNTFYPVKLMCKSPNYWGDNCSGNLHYFFMLEGCKPEDKIKTIHNEYLNSELQEHRKVIEQLSNKTMVDYDPSGLFGIGFNSTMGESLVIKSNNKLFNIKF